MKGYRVGIDRRDVISLVYSLDVTLRGIRRATFVEEVADPLEARGISLLVVEAENRVYCMFDHAYKFRVGGRVHRVEILKSCENVCDVTKTKRKPHSETPR